MPTTPHGQRTADPADLYRLRHRKEVEYLTTSEGARCQRTDTALTWYVDTRENTDIFVTEMIYNWRIITSPVRYPQLLNGGWCYFGRNFDTFTRALNAAHTYTPREGESPQGHDKEALPFWL